MKQTSLFFSLFSIFLLIGIISCKKEPNPNKQIHKSTNKQSIKYATGFEIEDYPNYKKLIIKSSYPDATETQTAIFVKPFKKYADFSDGKHVFYKPIDSIVVTSTTHIPMLELLQEEQSLVGFPNTKYISSPKTRVLIENGKIQELGKEQNINTELLLNLKPELVVGFSMSSNNKMFSNIEKAGIPVLLNGDWLEKTPLGRAEWIKFFGLIYGKEKQADSIFKSIETEYLRAKKIALQAIAKPKVLSGAMYKDKWNLPAGNSYGAQFLKDANVNYPWQNSKGNGSLSLSFEVVYNKAKDADFWLNPSFFNSYQQLADANPHYTQFDAFKNKKIFNVMNKKGKTGGILYYELAPMQPHIVLKDIIKTVHPELLDVYKPFYLEKIN